VGRLLFVVVNTNQHLKSHTLDLSHSCRHTLLLIVGRLLPFNPPVSASMGGDQPQDEVIRCNSFQHNVHQCSDRAGQDCVSCFCVLEDLIINGVRRSCTVCAYEIWF
jgi:hypothetical protein